MRQEVFECPPIIFFLSLIISLNLGISKNKYKKFGKFKNNLITNEPTNLLQY